MIPKAAIAASSKPLLITRNTREAPVCATRRITAAFYKARFDFNVGFFPQLGQISAGRRLQLLYVDGLADFIADVFQRGYSGLPVRDDLEDDKALLGLYHVSVFAGFQRKCLVFQLLGQFTALEFAEIATLGGGGSIRVFLCQFFKVRAFA